LIFNSEKLGAIVIQSYKPDYTLKNQDKDLFNSVSQHVASSIARCVQKLTLKVNAKTDSLTGLMNRSASIEVLERTISSSSNSSHSCVLFIDLNGLKAVSDIFGHEFGDDI
tara:strand:+ start:22 stop:354 length:333 start_codon:yes stop_codon:yes gene_type:complete